MTKYSERYSYKTSHFLIISLILIHVTTNAFRTSHNIPATVADLYGFGKCTGCRAPFYPPKFSLRYDVNLIIKMWSRLQTFTLNEPFLQ